MTFLPGVQVLFAFLLTVAFMQRYSEIKLYQRDVDFMARIVSKSTHQD